MGPRTGVGSLKLENHEKEAHINDHARHLGAPGGAWSFHVVDFETGTVVADYVDPATPDQTFRRTNSSMPRCGSFPRST
jgi:hypothetical protein